MPYNGDWATVLPDNSRNILYQGQQLMEISRQREAARLRQEKEDEERQANYLKLIGDSFDPSKHKSGSIYDPYAIQRIADTQNKWLDYVRQAKAGGKKVDEALLRQGIANDLGQINADDTRAKDIQKQVSDAIEAWKGPGVDHEKLAGLALNDYFVNTNPENGERGIDPTKWNREINGADLVQNAAEKYFGVVGTNKGVDEDMRAELKKDAPLTVKIDPLVKNDKVIAPGYNAKVPSYMEIKYDANQNPVGLDIRQEPVVMHGIQLKNADGTPKMSIAKDLEEKALAKRGFSLQVKKELADRIGEENLRREQAQRITGQPIPKVTEEEAEIMKKDIVLEKYRNNAQGGMVDQNGFDNYLKLRRLANSDRALDIAERKTALTQGFLDLKRKQVGEGDGSDVDYFGGMYDAQKNTYNVETTTAKPEDSGFLGWRKLTGKTIPGQAAEYKPTEIMRTDNMDDRELKNFAGSKDDKVAVKPIEFKLDDGTTIKGYKPLYNDQGELVGVQGANGVVKKETTNDFFNNKLFRKSAEGKVGIRNKSQTPAENKPQPSTQAKPQKIKGTTKSLFE